MNVFDDDLPVIQNEMEISGTTLRLKAVFCLEHEKENVRFSYYDAESEHYVDFGEPVKLRYTLDQFTGVRFTLLCYSTKKAGGEAGFENFSMSLG
jgi:hypothetical protein